MANKKYKLDGNDYWEASGVYDIGQSDTQRNINDEVVTKLATIEEGAEVNQNAFSNVTVGGTTIAADSKTDTLTLTAGSNITLTPNATNDSVTIAATDTTYGNATQSAAGLMSTADKKKLDTLDSSDITDNSDVGGATVEASLTSLKGSLNTMRDYTGEQIVVGPSEDFTTIVSAVAYSKNHPNTKIKVKPGNYDLVTELGGTDYINSHSMGTGIILDNGVHLIFEDGAKVTLNYTGTNADFKERFSPFTARNEQQTQEYADFTIENLQLECSNVRYAIHDDMGFSPTPYIHKFINCSLYIDNRNNDAFYSPGAIGGGFGRNGTVIIDGGYFKCEEDSARNPSEYNGTYPDIFYHSCAEQVNTKSSLILRNAELAHTFAGMRYGSITEKSILTVSSCKFGVNAPFLGYINNNTSYADNLVLREYDNDVTETYQAVYGNNLATITAKKVGKIVYVSITSQTVPLNAQVNITWATLPSIFRPEQIQQALALATYNGSETDRFGVLFYVRPDGRVQTNCKNTDTSIAIVATVSYAVD